MSASVRLNLAQRRCLRSCNVAGSNAVALNVELAVFRSNVFGQHLKTALGSRISGNRLASKLAHHGADVDNLSAALLYHAGNDSLGYDKGCVQIHIDYLTELVGAHLAHGDSLDNSRIVYKNINHAHFLFNLSHHSLYLLFVCNVAYIAVGFDAFLLIGSKTLVHQLLLDIVKYDGCARLGICGCNCKTDSVGCSRYQRHFAFQ